MCVVRPVASGSAVTAAFEGVVDGLEEPGPDIISTICDGDWRVHCGVKIKFQKQKTNSN